MNSVVVLVIYVLFYFSYWSTEAEVWLVEERLFILFIAYNKYTDYLSYSCFCAVHMS